MIFRKNKINKIEVDREVDGVEVWVVRWGRYSNRYDTPKLVDYEMVFKAFVNKPDANDFAKSLTDANSLIQNKTPLNIKIEKMD